MRSKSAAAALQPQMEAFASHMSGSASSMLAVDGKLKLPKRKKVLTPEQEAEKHVISFFKKLPGQALALTYVDLHAIAI